MPLSAERMLPRYLKDGMTDSHPCAYKEGLGLLSFYGHPSSHSIMELAEDVNKGGDLRKEDFKVPQGVRHPQ